MAATIVDLEEGLETEMSTEELAQSIQGDTPETQETPDDDDIPEKYKGKSIKEIISMHQEAEKKIGAQGGEVGELRKVVDQYIQDNLAQQTRQQTQATPQGEPEEVPDFFEDPTVAVSHAIANHPDVKAAKQAATNLSHQSAEARLRANHPDAPQIVNDPEFAKWVTSSRIRTELFARADAEFDIEAADELLTLWKERTGVLKAAVEQDKAARSDKLKAADTGATKGAAAAPSGKKRYRRADLIKLMMTDPDRYEQMAPEIQLAYEEKRVY